MPTRRYTEEQFRTALRDPQVRTMADLCRALGLVPRGANYETLRAYASELGIDPDRIVTLHRLGVSESTLRLAAETATSMGDLLRKLGLPDRSDRRRWIRDLLGNAAPDASPRPVRPDGSRARRSYTDEQLRRALAKATNYGELCEFLGLRPRSGSYRRLREHAADLGIPIPSGWSRPGPVGHDGIPRKPPKLGPPSPPSARYDSLELAAAVVAATCVAEAIRVLGHEPSSTTRRHIAQDIQRYGLDTSHFRPSTARGGRARRPIEERLVRGVRVNSGVLRRRLIEEGLREARCEHCHRTEWSGCPIPLELDHIDGDRYNNLAENLRLLCPNCHAMTPTYRGRNIGRQLRVRTGADQDGRGDVAGEAT